MICVRPSQRIDTPPYSPAESIRPHPLGQYQSLQARDHGSRVAKEDHLDTTTIINVVFELIRMMVLT